MTAQAAIDQAYMAHALRLAAEGLYTTDPNPRVGCVLVREGEVVGEGWHYRAGEPHAEVHALRAAGERARGAIAYVTLEPCSHTGRTPPCADALIAAGVARVCCATQDPNPQVAGGGIARLRAAGITVDTGPMTAAARALNVGFFSRFERGRPYVRLKLAMSLDGRTAHANGVHAWITGEAARLDVQRLRARSSAVLTGAGTVRCDDPQLDVRLAYGDWVRQPLRVVLDTGLNLQPEARLLQGHDAALVIAAHDAQGRVGSGAVALQRVGRSAQGLDLAEVIAVLQARGINELLVECGATLAGSFLLAGLVDELIVYVAPQFLGARAAPLAVLEHETGVAALQGFEFTDVRRVGADLRLTLQVRKGH